MNDFFDKISVVNLNRRKDRMDSVNEQCKRLGINVSRYAAYDGTELTSRPGKPPHSTWSMISMGNYGNVLSQRALIQEAIDNKYKSIMILEDDVEFSSIDKINEYLSKVPKNWDMIYLGGNHEKPYTKIDDMVAKCTYTYTAHAVGIRDTMYEHLLYYTRELHSPIDMYYAELHSSYNVYTSIKNLAWQIPGYSDIQEMEVDYSAILK